MHSRFAVPLTLHRGHIFLLGSCLSLFWKNRIGHQCLYPPNKTHTHLSGIILQPPTSFNLSAYGHSPQHSTRPGNASSKKLITLLVFCQNRQKFFTYLCHRRILGSCNPAALISRSRPPCPSSRCSAGQSWPPCLRQPFSIFMTGTRP